MREKQKALRAVRSDVLDVASRVNALAFTFETINQTCDPSDLESYLRHSNLPFALEEYFRQRINQAYANHSIFAD